MEAHHALKIMLRTFPQGNTFDNPEYMIIVHAIQELERLYKIEGECCLAIEKYKTGNGIPKGIIEYLDSLILKK